MDAMYDDYYNKAIDLQHHFEDTLDNHNHPQAQILQKEIHALADDFKTKRHPRSVEERVKNIEHTLLQARYSDTDMMSYQDVDHLTHEYQKLRESIRQMPNY